MKNGSLPEVHRLLVRRSLRCHLAECVQRLGTHLKAPPSARPAGSHANMRTVCLPGGTRMVVTPPPVPLHPVRPPSSRCGADTRSSPSYCPLLVHLRALVLGQERLFAAGFCGPAAWFLSSGMFDDPTRVFGGGLFSASSLARGSRMPVPVPPPPLLGLNSQIITGSFGTFL